MVDCLHTGRAVGPWFETSLLCGGWRLHRLGDKQLGIRKWWPKEVPMPSADPYEDSETEYEDFKGCLESA